MGFVILPAPEHHLVHQGNSQCQADKSTHDHASFPEFFPDHSSLFHQLFKGFTRFQEGLDIEILFIFSEFGIARSSVRPGRHRGEPGSGKHVTLTQSIHPAKVSTGYQCNIKNKFSQVLPGHLRCSGSSYPPVFRWHRRDRNPRIICT